MVTEFRYMGSEQHQKQFQVANKKETIFIDHILRGMSSLLLLNDQLKLSRISSPLQELQEEPKGIPWTLATPYKAGADGWCHMDVHNGDIVAWPTNLGWMMGRWLIYASLLNGGSVAL
ncbi:acyl-activating enzyme 17 [Artemisia annua]|uniref:Acyl-activating enzyme 17 n=1 Tax=Artemisia annua TaxID=35608 RepID=A0A2U1KV22_ARTAN|nr:acyl-activating enzyme 17 [Artemisia annua]